MLNTPGLNTARAHHDIAKHLGAVGVTIPDGVLYAIAVDEALHVAARPDPTADLRDAIDRRDDPKKVAAVIGKASAALAAADKVEHARIDSLQHLDRIARHALLEAGDQVIGELRPGFDDALAIARDAIDTLGPDHPGSDVLARPKLRAIWESSEDAQRRLKAIDTVVADLADVGYRPTSDHRMAMYLVHPEDFDTIPLKLWPAITAGYHVRLNTPSEANAVCAERDRAAAERAAQREAKKAHDRQNNPMARAFRQAAQLNAPHGGPKDAA